MFTTKNENGETLAQVRCDACNRWGISATIYTNEKPNQVKRGMRTKLHAHGWKTVGELDHCKECLVQANAEAQKPEGK